MDLVMKMSDVIRDMSLKLLEMRENEKEFADAMQVIKAATVVEIEIEWEDTKDSGLSNQTKRNAAVEGILLANEEYQELSKKHKELRKEIQLLQFDLDYEKREFQRSMHTYDSELMRKGFRLTIEALKEVKNSVDEVNDSVIRC